MVSYDWDDAKREINLVKHGVDFVDAWQVFESREKETFLSPKNNEERRVDIAPIEGRLMVLVYMVRDDTVWVISYRKARHPKETRRYDSARNREIVL